LHYETSDVGPKKETSVTVIDKNVYCGEDVYEKS